MLEVERLRALGEGTPGARVTREAVGETAAQARLTQGGDRRLGVLPRLQVMLPGVERGDTGVDGLGEAKTGRGVGIVRGVIGAVGEDDVVEVRAEVAVAGTAAEHRPPHVPVGVDEARQDDAVRPVDHLRAVSGEPAADSGDPVALDADVAVADGPECLVHRQDAGTADECLAVRHVHLLVLLLATP